MTENADASERDAQDADGSNYDPKNLEDARRAIEALEKRLGERDATITGLKSQLDGVSERISAMETAQRKQLEQPIADMFNRLKERLEIIPTSAQRRAGG